MGLAGACSRAYFWGETAGRPGGPAAKKVFIKKKLNNLLLNHKDIIRTATGGAS